MKVNQLPRITYNELNHQQKETYNFQKVSALLADYGFTTLKSNDNTAYPYFIAQHIEGEVSLKVHLKGRLIFDKKYVGKHLHVCFPYEGKWYIYDHDVLLQEFLDKGRLKGTSSWDDNGLYHFPSLGHEVLEILLEWQL